MNAEHQAQFIKFLKSKRCLTTFKKAYEVFEVDKNNRTLDKNNRTFIEYLAENPINNAVSSAFGWEEAELKYKLGTFKKWSKLNADWRYLLGDNSWHSWASND